ncbi:glycosyltransferase family 4 protein [Marinomonas sp. RSW2]|uniref:Glycosyltransferase family 4 protein n=1 Tax=Marinomonas maritima TaxID=2940935 RepID=A0ABT5W9X9_9GAMM|nr:glycosyltransferase family 4 protein [Marinomonas maritima]MDE8601623.1 glycosyltransferase family 4 protein [Marinomonas maritima]
MKVAIIHDWLVTYAGAERVLEKMIECYPDADLYSLVDFLESDRSFIKNKKINTSFIQHLPLARKKYRYYLPLMPLAIEQFDLSSYDLVISSSHAVAKGVITGPDQFHICMCYSPIRYAWDLQHQYLKESGLNDGLKGLLVKWFLHNIRIWDLRTVNGVDEFISISKFIKRRIKKIYNRDSIVIYPPVYINDFKNFVDKKEEFYITSSRMVPYKKIDLIVEAFTRKMPDKKLIVIGEGPDFDKIKRLSGKNVELMGYQPFPILKDYLSRAKAFIFAAEEDFGIAPLEAQASGTPVIAYAKGGALETIIGLEYDHPTGVFFYEQSIDSLASAVNKFENQVKEINSKNCVENAERFSESRFINEFKNHVENKYSIWKKKL